MTPSKTYDEEHAEYCVAEENYYKLTDAFLTPILKFHAKSKKSFLKNLKEKSFPITEIFVDTGHKWTDNSTYINEWLAHEFPEKGDDFTDWELKYIQDIIAERSLQSDFITETDVYRIQEIHVEHYGNPQDPYSPSWTKTWQCESIEDLPHNYEPDPET